MYGHEITDEEIDKHNKFLKELDKTKRKIEQLEDFFKIRGVNDKLKFLQILHDNVHKLPKEIKDHVIKRAIVKARQNKCKHKYPNGKISWVDKGGFIYGTAECSICGKTNIY